jgi:fructosamine-3-kinase
MVAKFKLEFSFKPFTMVQPVQETLRSVLSRLLGRTIGQIGLDPVQGGSVNQCFRIELDGSRLLFCKINLADRYPLLFEKERNGLVLLQSAGVLRVPAVLACEEVSGLQILILEWIRQGPRKDGFWERFGEELALLHQVTQSVFGLDEDNYMGSLKQSNRQHSSWTEFYRDQRLRPQVELALLHHRIETPVAERFDNLYRRLESVFPSGPAALLHGDLWSGNFLSDEEGRAVLIDPAVYYGNPAMDLGMTTLFGGFEDGFYEAYRYHSPFPSNYREQWEICKLYPLLIHLNLFGSSYLPEILRTIRSY